MTKLWKACDHCGKPPVVNLQKLWVKWRYYAKTDDYSRTPHVLEGDTSDGDNLHYCRDCLK